jgi:hypothetical protein
MVVIDAYKKVGLIFETYEGRRLSVAIFPNGTYSDIADASSSSGAEIREFYTGDTITDKQKAWNTETVELVEQGRAVAVIKDGTAVLTLSYMGSGRFLYTVNIGFAIGIVEVTVTDGIATVEKETIEADKELSSISQNPVKNWVITAALNNKVDKTYVDEAIANAITTTLNTAV